MGWEIVAGFILAIVFGPAILAFLAPAIARRAAFCFVLGGLQIAMGVTLYLMIYAGGVNWPWPLVIAVLGAYYVYRGTELRRLRVQSSDEGDRKVETEVASSEVRVEPSDDARRAT